MLFGQFLLHYHGERNHQGLGNKIIEPGDEVGQPAGKSNAMSDSAGCCDTTTALPHSVPMAFLDDPGRPGPRLSADSRHQPPTQRASTALADRNALVRRLQNQIAKELLARFTFLTREGDSMSS